MDWWVFTLEWTVKLMVCVLMCLHDIHVIDSTILQIYTCTSVEVWGALFSSMQLMQGFKESFLPICIHIHIFYIQCT